MQTAMHVYWLGLLLFLPTLIGCGSSQVKVSGRVLHKGEPLPGGMVTFRPEDPKHNSQTVPIDESGQYEVTLPAGDVQVSVDNRELKPRKSVAMKLPSELTREAKAALARNPLGAAAPTEATAAPPRLAGKYVPIDEKYYRVDTSELQFKIDPAHPQLDIDLK